MQAIAPISITNDLQAQALLSQGKFEWSRQASIRMIEDLASDALPDVIETGICIVGAGPVGIVLALSLARAGVDVVLLESGGATSEPEAEALNASHVAGRWHEGIHTGRYRALGGTSTRWGGQVLPFDEINFQERAGVAGSGWPIGFEEIEPYYQRALAFEGLGIDNLEDPEAWSNLGLPTPDLGEEIRVHLSRWCPEPDFARLHGTEIESSTSLRCILHATVTSISVEGTSVDAVGAKSLHGKSISVRADRFVFCAGAIETARLLLHPTSNGQVPSWAGPESLLGRCFQDHPAFACADVVPNDRAALHDLADMIYLRGRKYQPRFFLDRRRLERLESVGVGGHLIFHTAQYEVLATLRTAAREFVRRPSLRGLWRAARLGAKHSRVMRQQAWRYAVKRRATNPDDLGIRLLAFVEQPPRKESRVELAEDVDELGMRRTRLHWIVGQQELHAVAEFAAAVKRAFESRGLAGVTIDESLARLDPAFLDTGWDNYHHMGTARAATSPSDGVVDPNLQMFGVANAFICGCAVFPTGGFSNPTHTAIALAIRLSDHLLQLERKSAIK